MKHPRPLRHPSIGIAFVATLVAGILLPPAPAGACTRCTYLGGGDTVIVGRSMDWVENPGSEIWVFPRGLSRQGAAGAHSLSWRSRYGSVVCSFYGVATVDGMNEKGLVANALYLVESDYGPAVRGRPNLSIAAWTQYALDNFASVDEAVAALRREPFTVIAPTLPNGAPANGHLALSDATGDSAVFEYVAGRLVIHHGREYQVMTNSPTFDQQLALDRYWQEIGGTTFLPGTSRAADRFARASFFIRSLPRFADAKQATAAMFSVIRGVSVPLGIRTPGAPNIASTVWRTVYDLDSRVMFFDSATSPTLLWLPMASLDFSPGARVLRLPLAGGQTYGGDATASLVPDAPFPFLPGTPR